MWYTSSFDFFNPKLVDVLMVTMVLSESVFVFICIVDIHVLKYPA